MLPLCCIPETNDVINNNTKSSKTFFPSNSFSNISWENTIPFKPNISYGKVIKVYDGDTITIAAKPYREEPVFRFTLRLLNVDCPEIRSKDENEKKAAIIVRDKLKDLIYNKCVSITDIASDKYGRVLCNVWLDDCNISNWLLTNNLAVKYDGGKKEVPNNWLTYINQK